MGYVKKERSTLCETCGETDKVKLLNYKPICYSCVDAKKVKSFRSVECETCGETDKDKLTKRKPICYSCRDKVYYKKSREGKPFGRQNIKISINIPDGVEDPLKYYQKEYNKIHYQQNKEHRNEKIRYRKRIQTLKKYCGLLNKDFNDYLKDDLTYDEVIKINESLKTQVYPPKEPRTCFYCFSTGAKYHYNLQKFLCKSHYKEKDDEYIAEQEIKQKNKELYLDPVRYKEHLTSEFIKKVETKFGKGIYNLSQLDYKNTETPVTLICEKGGHTFNVVPKIFLKFNVNPCPICATDKTHTVDKYINLAIEKYGDQFDYSSVNYINKRTPVAIKCNKHNLLFEQALYTHAVLGSIGCPNCHIEKTNKQKPNNPGTIDYTIYKKTTEYKLKQNLRGRIRRALKRKFATNTETRTEEILGCKIEYFKEYLESKFEPWMTWENYGLYNGELNYGWDIDHVTPLSSANTIEDIYELNHYKNLQPLCSKVNRDIKSNSLDFDYNLIPEILK